MSESTSIESNGKESVQGITKISVRGFKSLYEECSIEIRPLTILAGANSSGKSSIIQPLLLMKQTLEATYDPGALLLNGSHVRFTLLDQILSSNKNKSYVINNFDTTIEIAKHHSIKNVFGKSIKPGINLIEMSSIMPEETICFLPEMTHEEIVESLPDWRRQNYELINRGILGEKQPKWIVKRNRCFFEFLLRQERDNLDRINPAWPMGFYLRQLIHLPGLRGNPERTYNTTAIGSEFTGTFENYVASVINHWKNTKDNRLKDLEIALKTLGLTSKIDAIQVNDVQIELHVGRLPESDTANDMVNIADVGIGVSQVLPVIVALLVAEPGQLVYIEQPEIHLHPRAQAALAEILADAANRGVKVAIETHSELLLLAIQSLVAEEKLSIDKVKLHWFTRGENGMTKVSSADLDDAGAFGDWPEDFGDVSLKLESRYLDAAESRLWKRSHGG